MTDALDKVRKGERFRLGVDVGGTFTDLLLIDEGTGRTFSAKVPSTPADPSVAVLHGILRVAEIAGIEPKQIGEVMHGTTVATNTVLTASGAKVGLIVKKGYRNVLQVGRSFIPGGLGGWVIWQKRPILAPLECTIEADERIGAGGEIVKPLDEAAIHRALDVLRCEGVEAVAVSLFNAYANGAHERRVREIAAAALPGISVSISSEVMPEMYEYERTETTVVNSYVRPVVANYVENLAARLHEVAGETGLHILRSDGGLASAESARSAPVNLLMSGPAGGVTGAIWAAGKAGFTNLLTLDVGGTSTDVALIQDGVAHKRRETRVADVTVRASSIDVRTVGAGGGSIAYVPELTKALRVGPQSAGAVPGPAAYGRGGALPTVTDANVILGYLPANVRLGGDMTMSQQSAEAAVQPIADALGLSLKAAAEGIVRIVNENMFGALRLVSIEQGFDPREFALVAFGGAGPLHGNALGILTGAWPVIVPAGPGILCAYGDATTRLRDERGRTFIRRFGATSDAEVQAILDQLADQASTGLTAELPGSSPELELEIDVRYRGQGMSLTVKFTPDDFAKGGLAETARRFDRQHEQLFTFALDTERELVNLRVIALGPSAEVDAPRLPKGSGDPAAAVVADHSIFYDGADHAAKIYNRTKLRAGDRIFGPAVILQMDTTTVILPGHVGEIEPFGNLLIQPVDSERA